MDDKQEKFTEGSVGIGKPFAVVRIEELKAISAKRKKCNPRDGFEKPADNLFGIALSGGGIRSATINFGVLEVLTRVGILPKADYLSTVSGGGYTGGYLQTKLRRGASYDDLFCPKDREHLIEYGYYLTPGKRFRKFLNEWRLAGAFVFSLVMSWITIISFFLWLSYLSSIILEPVFRNEAVFKVLCRTIVLILAFHFFFHFLRHIGLWSSNALNRIEGILLFLIVLSVAGGVGVGLSITNLFRAVLSLNAYESSCRLIYTDFVIITAILSITGFFSNPNILSMHRFYRDRLATAFLGVGGKGDSGLKLFQLNPGQKAEDWGIAPYPLINTCLNLFGSKQDSSGKREFIGTRASNNFLLSPLYCGSKLTGYAPTEKTIYKKMTFSSAIAISGAALNPTMGGKTNRFLAFFMALFNLKLGYWALNPKTERRQSIVWWPPYLLSELFSRMHTKMLRVNLSDGGHIENLGIYELLSRRCRLIIAVDASADPEYKFVDLENLVRRAKNELGLSIRFRTDPETLIRPLPSKGFSVSHFAIADIEGLPGAPESQYGGLLVYLKSSMKEPQSWKEIEEGHTLFDSFQYKTYHPEFPHESTADQFFDKAQWEAYYNLGRFIAGDLLGVDVRSEDETSKARTELAKKTINDLYHFFSTKTPEMS